MTSELPATMEKFGADGHLMVIKVHSWFTLMPGMDPEPIISWHGAVHSDNCICWTRGVPLGIHLRHNRGDHSGCPTTCPVRSRKSQRST